MSVPEKTTNDLKKDFIEALEQGPARWAKMNAHPFEEDLRHDATIKGNTTYYTTTNGDGSKTYHSYSKLPDTYQANLNTVKDMKEMPSLAPNGVMKGENCIHTNVHTAGVHNGAAVIPGTMTTISQGQTTTGTHTHIIQPHEKVTVKGDTNMNETSTVRNLSQVDLRLHEHSSTPGFIVQEKPVYVVKEKPVYVDRPVYIEKPVEKPVVIEKTIDRPVYVEKIIEKPVVIEKTIERPVYIVHETPGVVVGGEFKVKDASTHLTHTELDKFVKSEGLTSDCQTKTFIAPPHLIHGDLSKNPVAPSVIHHAHTVPAGVQNVSFPAATENVNKSNVWVDSRGHHMHHVSEAEFRRLSGLNTSSFVSQKNTPTYTTTTVEQPDNRSWWSRLFGGSHNKAKTVEVPVAQNTSYVPMYGQSTFVPGQSRTTSNTSVRGDKVTTTTTTTTTAAKVRDRRPWFFGDGIERESKFARTDRDPTFLESGGLLETASSSPAEHYYRFGNAGTVDRPTEPVHLDQFIHSQAAHYGHNVPHHVAMQQNIAAQRAFPPVQISQHSASNDWHLQNLYVAPSGEIVNPLLPHASVTELGRVMEQSGAQTYYQQGANPAPGATIQRGVDGVANAVDSVVDGAKRAVDKTIDTTVNMVDKTIDKAHDVVHDAKSKINEVKTDRSTDRTSVINDTNWWTS